LGELTADLELVGLSILSIQARRHSEQQSHKYKPRESHFSQRQIAAAKTVEQQLIHLT